jgi:hypothetical protein
LFVIPQGSASVLAVVCSYTIILSEAKKSSISAVAFAFASEVCPGFSPGIKCQRNTGL